VGNTEFGGKLVRIDLNDNVVKTEVEGPADPTQRVSAASASLNLELDREKNQVRISLQGQEETVQNGMESTVQFHFRINAFLKSTESVDSYLGDLPELKVYLSPIQF